MTATEHSPRCTCLPCNPRSCDVKHPTRQHYCDLDEGHDGPHNDYEDMFQWSDDDGGGA